MPSKRPVLVEWEDAHSANGWLPGRDIQAWHDSPVIVEQVGFVARQDKRGLTLAFGRDRGDGSFLHLEFIPTGMIRRVRKLK